MGFKVVLCVSIKNILNAETCKALYTLCLQLHPPEPHSHAPSLDERLGGVQQQTEGNVG